MELALELKLTHKHVARMRELWAKREQWEAAGRDDATFPEDEMTELMELTVLHTEDLLNCAGAITGELAMHPASFLLGTGLTNVIGRHEHEEHEGERCINERGNIMAYLAHRAGVTDRHTLEVMVMRIDHYRAMHEEHHLDDHNHSH